MLTIRRILVPTDLSDASVPAVRYAADLADAFRAELVLLHVVQDLALVLPDAVMPTPMPNPDLTQLLDSARAGLTGFVSAHGLDRQKPRQEVRVGSPAEEIDDAAKELAADLICVSTHARTGLAHLFLGSIAESAVRHAPCPVLIIPPAVK